MWPSLANIKILNHIDQNFKTYSVYMRKQFKIILILPNSTSTKLKAEIAIISSLPCHPPTKPPSQLLNWFLNVQIYWIKKNIDLAALEMFLHKGDQSKSHYSKNDLFLCYFFLASKWTNLNLQPQSYFWLERNKTTPLVW